MTGGWGNASRTCDLQSPVCLSAAFSAAAPSPFTVRPFYLVASALVQNELLVVRRRLAVLVCTMGPVSNRRKNNVRERDELKMRNKGGVKKGQPGSSEI